MAVINPPGFLQNAGATHTAEQMRDWFSIAYAGRTASGSLISRGGVHPALGNSLFISQTGSPSMAVLIKSGMAVIPGSEGSKQGAYSVLNDADVTLSISAAHATLNRIDSVVFKVEDTAYSGVSDTSSLVVVTGTPASSPAAPTLPANCIELAQVSILANDTSITNAEITDKRHYLAGVGGVITVASPSVRPASATVTGGQIIYEESTDKLYITHDAGANWDQFWAGSQPRGWIGENNPTAITSTTTVETIHATLTATLSTGRRYRLTFFGQYQSTVAGDLIQINMRIASGATVTAAGTRLRSTAVHSEVASRNNTIAMSTTFTVASSGQWTVGTFILRNSGTGTVKLDYLVNIVEPTMVLEDIGS